jgi:hypothetical protein
LKTWFDKRDAVNRYFASEGYRQVNANKKPWCEGPYGRETQAISAFSPKRNWLTTDETARLLFEIAEGRAVTAERSQAMLALMKRDLAPANGKLGDQAVFTGPTLPPGAQLWSKAGWTSQVRHDATIVKLPQGSRFILVVFTENHSAERGIIHCVARSVTAAMQSLPRQP